MSSRRRLAPLALTALVAVLAPRAALAQSLPGAGAALPNGVGDAVTNMQGALMLEPSSRDKVMSLQDDAQIQAILQDPATMRAVQSGDLNALMADPKIRALSENPTVRALVEQQTR